MALFSDMMDEAGELKDKMALDRKAWLVERAKLQGRIKNQRRELRRLNAQARGLDLLVRNAFNREHTIKTNAYRHAAQMAETFHYWPFGKRIGAYIRKWC